MGRTGTNNRASPEFLVALVAGTVTEGSKGGLVWSEGAGGVMRKEGKRRAGEEGKRG